MKAKIILANATIIIISICVFLNGYAKSMEMPVYADSTTDQWTQVTTNQQLVDAFRYYCKSRNLVIEGSVADALTSFTTQTFNGICNFLGFDVTGLQAHIKYQTDGNNGIKYLFDTTGISAYNRIFAYFLQNNDLEEGDTNVNKPVYSGDYYTDADGFKCLVYYVDSPSSYYGNSHTPLKLGTAYKYSYNDLMSMQGSAASYQPYPGKYFNDYVTPQFEDTNYYFVNFTGQYIGTSYEYKMLISAKDKENGSVIRVGHRAIFNYNGGYYFGHFLNVLSPSPDNPTVSAYYWTIFENPFPSPDNNLQNVNISIVSNVINNNNYEGNTIINNNGDVINNNYPDNPNYNPYPDGGGTTTPSGNVGGDGSDGTINFPDFNINLPEINWSLGDLSNKFPFSIPFDMIAFLTLLNGEPQAPHITGSIPLTTHYTWNLDLDFSQFDTFAGIMRGLEFVGFMFFLISATINIVRG